MIALLAVTCVKQGLLDTMPHSLAVQSKSHDLCQSLVAHIERLVADFTSSTSPSARASRSSGQSTSLDHHMAVAAMLARRHKQAVVQWVETTIISMRALRALHAASIDKEVHDALAKKAQKRAEQEARMAKLASRRRSTSSRRGRRLSAAAPTPPILPSSPSKANMAAHVTMAVARAAGVLRHVKDTGHRRRRSLVAMSDHKSLLQAYRKAEAATIATPPRGPKKARKASGAIVLAATTGFGHGSPMHNGAGDSGDTEQPAKSAEEGKAFDTWMSMFKVARKLRSKAAIMRVASDTVRRAVGESRYLVPSEGRRLTCVCGCVLVCQLFDKGEVMQLQASMWEHWLSHGDQHRAASAPLPGEDVLTLDAFEGLLREHYPEAGQLSSTAVSSLFTTMNSSGSGLMSFAELCGGLSTLLRESPSKKAAFVFKVLDSHGIGMCSRALLPT